MSRRRSGRAVPLLAWGAAVVTAALLLVGCGSPSAAPTSTGSADVTTRLSEEALQTCRSVFARELDEAPARLILVWDASGSRADLPFPEALIEDVQAVSRAGGSLTVIGVEGEGIAPPIVARNVALNTPGDLTRPSVAKIAQVMPACVQQTYLEGIVPTAAGTDLHQAMSLASEFVTPAAAASTTVWVVSDLLSNTGPLKLTANVLAQSPATAADQAARSAPLDLHSATLKMAGLGAASTPLLTAHRGWLVAFARDLCAAWQAQGCADITASPVNAIRANAQALPADQVPPFPTVAATGTQTSCTYTIPDQLTFEGDSAQLRAGFEEILRAPVGVLETNPAASLSVVGHTASSADYTAEQLRELATARAEAVRGAIVAAGISPDRLSAVGVGDTQPLGEDIDSATGTQIPEMAARERRVELVLTGAPCS